MHPYRNHVASLVLALTTALATAQDATAVRPGDNFYRYANDGWSAMPHTVGDLTRDGITPMLAARNRDRVQQLLAELAAQPQTGDELKISDYHTTLAADSPATAAKALAAVHKELKAVNALKDTRALSIWLAQHLSLDDGSNQKVPGLFGIWVHQGFHNPDRHSVHFTQGGLELGGRDAYLGNSPEQAQARQAHHARMAKLLALAGRSAPQRDADAVLALETAIARAHATRADTDDVPKTDNTWRRADFDRLAPGIHWAGFFQAAGLRHADHFTVWQPDAVKGVSALVAQQPLQAWKAYAAAHLLTRYAPVLPLAYRSDSAAPRAAVALAMTNAALGEAIGKAYVARHVPSQTQQAVQAMVARIRAAFGPRIAALTWLSDAGKAMAQRKLQHLELGLGYPHTWTDYTALRVARGDAYGNLRRAEAFAWAQSLAKLKLPVDPAEWALLPQTTGAILNFSPNSMQFASGLFQPPYFDPQGDLASNYGSAGAGLAHEVSHTFDELGRDYDDRGNLQGWWSAADGTAYKTAQTLLAEQIATVCPLPDVCVSAPRTLGESTADLAGLHAAHDAYRAALSGKPDVVVNGLTGEQRFFIAFARRWRRTLSDEALKQYIATDNHLPPESRANAVRHVDAWYEAFNIQPGDKLYLPPEKRSRVW